jgi:adenylate cyclase
MGIEIERKFLVRGDAWRAQASRRIAMDQGYLGGDRCSVRVRLEDEIAMLNIKSREAGAQRIEFEYPIPVQDAEDMLARLAGPRVTKMRHHVIVDGALFEVDEFAGANAGLIVAEIELDAIDAAFPRPDWLGREVTDEVRFYNLRLAETPFSTWPDRVALIEEIAC